MTAWGHALAVQRGDAFDFGARCPVMAQTCGHSYCVVLLRLQSCCCAASRGGGGTLNSLNAPSTPRTWCRAHPQVPQWGQCQGGSCRPARDPSRPASHRAGSPPCTPGTRMGGRDTRSLAPPRASRSRPSRGWAMGGRRLSY